MRLNVSGTAKLTALGFEVSARVREPEARLNEMQTQMTVCPLHGVSSATHFLGPAEKLSRVMVGILV